MIESDYRRRSKKNQRSSLINIKARRYEFVNRICIKDSQNMSQNGPKKYYKQNLWLIRTERKLIALNNVQSVN